MKRNVNRVKKIGLQHLITKLVKLERRMERILKEYYATQEAIQFFQKEKQITPEVVNQTLLTTRTEKGVAAGQIKMEENLNAIPENGKESGTIDGASTSEGSGGIQLPVQRGDTETLVETREPAIQDNPPTQESSL